MPKLPVSKLLEATSDSEIGQIDNEFEIVHRNNGNSNLESSAPVAAASATQKSVASSRKSTRDADTTITEDQTQKIKDQIKAVEQKLQTGLKRELKLW